MAQEVHSFWTDIKKYEDILAKDPNSFCFAQLSELYRRIGLLDDAIYVANRGIEIHPDYVGGHLALGRAYFDKGQQADSREVLERVVRATPENYTAQKLLSQIYLASNAIAPALKTLRIVLELNPDDVESRLSLEALARVNEKASPSVSGPEDEEDLEEAEIVDDELDFQEYQGFEPGVVASGHGEPDVLIQTLPDQADLSGPDSGDPDALVVSGSGGPDSPETGVRDPLTTATLAEIYLAQGFFDQALKIYRELADEGLNLDRTLTRIAEIEQLKECAAGLPEAETSGTAGIGVSRHTADPAEVVAVLEQLLENIDKRRSHS